MKLRLPTRKIIRIPSTQPPARLVSSEGLRFRKTFQPM
jgi:hypothetical protein